MDLPETSHQKCLFLQERRCVGRGGGASKNLQQKKIRQCYRYTETRKIEGVTRLFFVLEFNRRHWNPGDKRWLFINQTGDMGLKTHSDMQQGYLSLLKLHVFSPRGGGGPTPVWNARMCVLRV